MRTISRETGCTSEARRACRYSSTRTYSSTPSSARRVTPRSGSAHDVDALATNFIATWRRFRVVDNTVDLLDSALAIRATHGLSLWDCMIVAAALEAGCDTLLTEDLSHGQVMSGLRVENPFR